MHVHQAEKVLELGSTPEDTRKIIILLHGRGANAESMLPVAESLQMPGSRVLIPQAAGNRWYPLTAFGPLEPNEPDLSSALQVVDDLISDRQQQGWDRNMIYLGGFSQGACLAAEYLARNPVRLGGLFVLSGALIGPPEENRIPEGDLIGMPIFIGGSDVDPWISHNWMEKAADYFVKSGANVDFQTYPGLGHTVNQDEIERVRKMISA